MAERGPLVGIDYGRARIGLAVSDQLGVSTQPIGFVARTTDHEAAQVVAAVVREQAAIGVVVGLPLHAHGDAGQAVNRVRRFCKRLTPLLAIPVHEVDERWSSEEAEEILRGEGAWPPAPGVLDARSAAIILRRYLDDGGEEKDVDGTA